MKLLWIKICKYINIYLMKILNFKLFNESIVTRDDLYPKDEIEHKDMIEPALLTFKEYFSKLQEGPGKKWHEDNVYNYSLDDNIRTIDINDKKWKRLKRIKVDKIIIDFYQDQTENQYVAYDGNDEILRDENGDLIYKDNKELNKNGKITKYYNIVAYHPDEKLVVGSADDEWGCVLITVLKEYRNLGIGEVLIDLYRHYFPHKPTGGVTNAGYNQLKRFHTRLVRKYLENGIYSDMVKKGDITVTRVKEIVNSIEKRKYAKTGNEFSKTYGGSGKLMFILDESYVIIFDKDIQKMVGKEYEINERFIKKLLKCFIYINQFRENVDYENLFTVYAESDEMLKIGLDLLLSSGVKISDYFLNRRFDNNTKELINKLYNNEFYNIEEVEGTNSYEKCRVISAKNSEYNFLSLKKQSDKWFKENDKHEEFRNFLMEFAERIADKT